MIKVLKGILLYSTLIYFCLFLLFAESLTLTAFIVALVIFVFLFILCYKCFTVDELADYVPKWFKK